MISVISKSHSLKNQRFTPSGCKDLGIRTHKRFLKKLAKLCFITVPNTALWSLQIKLVFSVYRLWKDLVNFLNLMKFPIKCYPGNISIEHMNTKTENGRDGLHYSVYHQRYSARFKLCSSLYLNIQSVPYHIRLSPSFNAKINP